MTIPLKNYSHGEIQLQDGYIVIDDKSSRMNRILFQLFPYIFFLLGTFQISEGIQADRQIQIILHVLGGILLLAIPVLLFKSTFKRTNQKQLQVAEIKVVRIKQLFGEFYIDFELNNR